MPLLLCCKITYRPSCWRLRRSSPVSTEECRTTRLRPLRRRKGPPRRLRPTELPERRARRSEVPEVHNDETRNSGGREGERVVRGGMLLQTSRTCISLCDISVRVTHMCSTNYGGRFALAHGPSCLKVSHVAKLYSFFGFRKHAEQTKATQTYRPPLPPPYTNHLYTPQEQQRELKKAQKEAAKAAKKADAGGGSTGAPPAAAAPPASTARGVSEPMATAVTLPPAGTTETTVQFCAAMPPTVAYAACSLTQTKLAFLAGEVSFSFVVFGEGAGVFIWCSPEKICLTDCSPQIPVETSSGRVVGRIRVCICRPYPGLVALDGVCVRS